MTEIIIDKKKYILMPENKYHALQKRAALKTKPDKTFTVEAARSYSKKLIKKWAEEK
ncbi:MAG: hypothetical protein ACTHJN_15285 [Ginsengibacter sp.]